MALTEPATMREEAPVPVVPARRSLVSRLSIGHVVMILAGLVAILLNLAFLRSNTATIRIAVAGSTLQAGSVLGAGSLTSIEIGDAGSLADGLLTENAAVELYGSIIAHGVEAGEPIRRSDLRPSVTPSGLREYSILIGPAEAAGGVITASDVVDIIAVIDNQAFYVAAGIDVVRVSGEGAGLGASGDLIIVLSVDDRTALEIESARASGSIAVVRSTGATPPSSGPVTVQPSLTP